MTTDRCIIIPAAVQAKAQALCKGLAGVAGDGMFVVGLSASGKAPTATTSTKPLTAGNDYFFGVTPGDKVSVIAAS